MNGEYPLSETPGSKDMANLFPKRYADYPGGAEMFEMYSPPISTLYSQIFWAPLAPVKFPDDVVKKYAGKGMAIVGCVSASIPLSLNDKALLLRSPT